MTSPVVQHSPNRPWAFVPGVVIGPGAWHTSPVYSVSWLQSDYAVFAFQSGDWTHSETSNSDGTRRRFDSYTNYRESRVGGTRAWDNLTAPAWTETETTQEQIFVQLEDFSRTVWDIPGSWQDAIPPPPDLASGQTWHIEYENETGNRSQRPEVQDIQRLVVRLAVASNLDASQYFPAAGVSRFRLVPKDLVPRNALSFGSALAHYDSSGFQLLATYSFDATTSSGAVELTVDDPPVNAVNVMAMTVDSQSAGVPYVGPPPDWDFDAGQYRETWSARLQPLPEDDTNVYTLIWQPPRWRYIYEEPTAGVPGDVTGGIDHQVSAFRPRVPTGGVRFDTASDLDPTPSWQDYHPDPRLERGGPAFE